MRRAAAVGVRLGQIAPARSSGSVRRTQAAVAECVEKADDVAEDRFAGLVPVHPMAGAQGGVNLSISLATPGLGCGAVVRPPR